MISLPVTCFLLLTVIGVTLGKLSKFGIPDECVDSTICFEEPSLYRNYPQKEIDEYLQTGLLPISPDDEEELEILNNEREDEINCSTEVRMLRPFSVKDENNRSYPVIQSKFFTQRIRHVTCKNHGGECMQNQLFQTDRYKATCETVKGKIDLYVFDDVTNKVKLMPVDVNSCCKCTIRDSN